MNGCRRSLSFDRVLEGCWFFLSLQEIDLEWQEEKLVEEQAWSLYSFDGRDLLAEQEEFCKRVAGVESERPAEAVQTVMVGQGNLGYSGRPEHVSLLGHP
jgi:hypothetical protein